MSNIIEIKNVSKKFKDQDHTVVALNNVSFKLEEGQSLSIIGTSGSGKSTLLHLLGGLSKPSEGVVSIDGRDLKNLDDQELSSFRNKTIGFIFQFFHLQEFLTAKENIALPLIIAGQDNKEAAARADELIKRIGLEERGHHIPQKLSGGEQQRVAIARALANKPKLILADEPTGNLDKENADKVFKYLKQISETGVSVVVITHDQNVKSYFPDSLILDKGSIKQ